MYKHLNKWKLSLLKILFSGWHNICIPTLWEHLKKDSYLILMKNRFKLCNYCESEIIRWPFRRSAEFLAVHIHDPANGNRTQSPWSFPGILNLQTTEPRFNDNRSVLPRFYWLSNFDWFTFLLKSNNPHNPTLTDVIVFTVSLLTVFVCCRDL